MTEQPLDHVLRPNLPWRSDQVTECGRAATDVASVIDADELIERTKRHGQQRTVFTVCMTCWDRAKYAVTWDQYPIAVLDRELHRVGADPRISPRKPGADRMTAELRAITALIHAHRDEFDSYLTGLTETVDLAARRSRRKRVGGPA